MGILSKLFGKKDMAAAVPNPEKNTIYAPLSGTVVSLAEINDGVFSSGVLGQGCGIYPDSETVVAPFDGTITVVAETKHAVGVQSKDGVELLIHVGLDTVSMNGKGFTPHVKIGDTVKCGQKLLSFQKKVISDAGFPDVTALLVTNTDDYAAVSLQKNGITAVGEKLITVE